MRTARTAALGFGILLVLVLVIGTLAIYGLRTTVAAESEARRELQGVVQIERLRYVFEQKVATSRAYLLTDEPRFLEEMHRERAVLLAIVDSLRTQLRTAEGKDLLQEIVANEAQHQAAFGRIAAMESARRNAANEAQLFLQEIKPARDRTDSAFVALTRHKWERTEEHRARAVRAERRWTGLTLGTSLAAVLLGALLAIYFTRAIARQNEAERQLREEVLAQSREVERTMLDLRATHAEALRRSRDPGKEP